MSKMCMNIIQFNSKFYIAESLRHIDRAPEGVISDTRYRRFWKSDIRYWPQICDICFRKKWYPILGFNFRYWLAKNPIFKTGKKSILDTKNLKIRCPILDPPPFWGPINIVVDSVHVPLLFSPVDFFFVKTCLEKNCESIGRWYMLLLN